MLIHAPRARAASAATGLMDVQTVTLLYGLLAIVGIVIARLAGSSWRSPRASRTRPPTASSRIRERLGPWAHRGGRGGGDAGHGRQPLLLGGRPLHALHAVLVPAHRHVPARAAPRHRRLAPRHRHPPLRHPAGRHRRRHLRRTTTCWSGASSTDSGACVVGMPCSPGLVPPVRLRQPALPGADGLPAHHRLPAAGAPRTGTTWRIDAD